MRELLLVFGEYNALTREASQERLESVTAEDF